MTKIKEIEKKLDEAEIPAVKGIGKGGKKGMHKGHVYSETCACARCTGERKKIIKSADEKKKIIDEWLSHNSHQISQEKKEEVIQNYKDNLPKGELFFKLDEDSVSLLVERLPRLKEKYKIESANGFIKEVLNDSLKFYLQTI